jgi:hypothetical protein
MLRINKELNCIKELDIMYLTFWITHWSHYGSNTVLQHAMKEVLYRELSSKQEFPLNTVEFTTTDNPATCFFNLEKNLYLYICMLLFNQYCINYS